MEIKIKRVYEKQAADDGRRFLVDRLWPRGIKKEALQVEAWLKDAAPSDRLRKEFHHEPEKWDDFKQAYFAELEANPEAWQPLLEAAQAGPVTLLYAAKDEQYNNAAALREYLLTHKP
jgi:uncharacterized protein YeaO (DUF488 family)